MLIGSEGFAKLPNGDGAFNSATGTAETLRRAVSDCCWGCIEQYGGCDGPIEDWDVSEVTNMANIFYGGCSGFYTCEQVKNAYNVAVHSATCGCS